MTATPELWWTPHERHPEAKERQRALNIPDEHPAVRCAPSPSGLVLLLTEPQLAISPRVLDLSLVEARVYACVEAVAQTRTALSALGVLLARLHVNLSLGRPATPAQAQRQGGRVVK